MKTVAEFVGRTPRHAVFDAAVGEENGEGIDVMIASAALAHRPAVKFAATDDGRVVEASPLPRW